MKKKNAAPVIENITPAAELTEADVLEKSEDDEGPLLMIETLPGSRPTEADFEAARKRQEERMKAAAAAAPPAHPARVKEWTAKRACTFQGRFVRAGETVYAAVMDNPNFTPKR